MTEQSLYNFSPALRVMLTGIALSAGPLAWAWMRHRKIHRTQRWRVLTLLTLFLTFDLVLFGAFTRLTDSGLGCPDWPGCYGSASPVGAQLHITAAQKVMPTGPVTHSKAWVEMVHRYLATSVGVLILVLAIAAWWEVWRNKKTNQSADAHNSEGHTNPWLASGTFLWVCVQGIFGMLTVTMKLFPAIVTLHLLGGILLLVLLCVQVMGYEKKINVNRLVRPLLWGVFILLWCQVALGGWVSTNYAVLACTQFPTCQGSWWPSMNFVQGFALWRPLGMASDGTHITYAALTAIHYVHRLMAYAVLVALGAAIWQLRKIEALQRQSRYLMGLTLLQVLTGVSNVLLGWPLVAAVLHTGGAAALLVVVTWALTVSRHRSEHSKKFNAPNFQSATVSSDEALPDPLERLPSQGANA